MTQTGQAFTDDTSNNLRVSCNIRVICVLKKGKIRIWDKDGTVPRGVLTDYVKSGADIPFDALIRDGNSATLYLEAINPSTDWSDIRIMVSLSLDNGSTWIASNAVRVTSMRCNFTIGVVRQFYIDKGKYNAIKRGLRTLTSQNVNRGWGEVADMTRLKRGLRRAYSGELYKGVPINTVDDLQLNDNTDRLRFYDPGLFPVVFGELPESVFDVNEPIK